MVFSLEMSAVQLMERLLCAGAGVSTTALRTGRIRREKLPELGLALPRLGELTDLRESGAIEQDADIVLFLYRDEVYHPDAANRELAELAIARYRGGATGVKQLRFDAEYTRFCDSAAM